MVLATYMALLVMFRRVSMTVLRFWYWRVADCTRLDASSKSGNQLEKIDCGPKQNTVHFKLCGKLVGRIFYTIANGDILGGIIECVSWKNVIGLGFDPISQCMMLQIPHLQSSLKACK